MRWQLRTNDEIDKQKSVSAFDRFTADGAVPLSEVVPDFTASLDQLRGVIAEQLSASHTFAGQKISGGVRLNDIVAGLCETVNKTGKICPPRFGVREVVQAQRTDFRDIFLEACHCLDALGAGDIAPSKMIHKHRSYIPA